MVRIALGQLNTTVGDLDGNVARMIEWTARAAAAGADLICFPELAITGYPPEDLVLRPAFVRDNLAALDALAASTADRRARSWSGSSTDRTLGLHNAAALLRGGRVQERYHKMQLPNFGVFDEKRYFVPGTRPARSAGIVGARALRLRGRVARRRAVRRVRAHTSPHRPQHQRLAVPPREGRGAPRSAAIGRVRPARGSST